MNEWDNGFMSVSYNSYIHTQIGNNHSPEQFSRNESNLNPEKKVERIYI